VIHDWKLPAGYNVDTLHHDLRHEVQVDLVALLGLHEALAVDQRQGAAAEVGVQAAQVGDVRAGEEV